MRRSAAFRPKRLFPTSAIVGYSASAFTRNRAAVEVVAATVSPDLDESPRVALPRILAPAPSLACRRCLADHRSVESALEAGRFRTHSGTSTSSGRHSTAHPQERFERLPAFAFEPSLQDGRGSAPQPTQVDLGGVRYGRTILHGEPASSLIWRKVHPPDSRRRLSMSLLPRPRRVPDAPTEPMISGPLALVQTTCRVDRRGSLGAACLTRVSVGRPWLRRPDRTDARASANCPVRVARVVIPRYGDLGPRGGGTEAWLRTSRVRRELRGLSGRGAGAGGLPSATPGSRSLPPVRRRSR